MMTLALLALTLIGEPGTALEGLPLRMSLQEAPKAPPAPAEAPAAAPQDNPANWRFDFAIYLWMASIQGDLTTGTLSSSVDVEFADALDYLQGGLTLHFEAWKKNRIGVIADINWMSFEAIQDVGPVEITASQTLGISEGAAALRFGEDGVFLDFLMGVRWVYLSTEIASNSGTSRHKDVSLLDPLIGARIIVQAAEWMSLSARVDVGGFGVGTDLSGQFGAYATFYFTDNLALVVGYKWMALEYENDRYLVDLRLSGPLLAFDIGF